MISELSNVISDRPRRTAHKKGRHRATRMLLVVRVNRYSHFITVSRGGMPRRRVRSDYRASLFYFHSSSPVVTLLLHPEGSWQAYHPGDLRMPHRGGRPSKRSPGIVQQRYLLRSSVSLLNRLWVAQDLNGIEEGIEIFPPDHGLLDLLSRQNSSMVTTGVTN